MNYSKMRSEEMALEIRRIRLTEEKYQTDDPDALDLINSELNEVHIALGILRLELYGNKREYV